MSTRPLQHHEMELTDVLRGAGTRDDTPHVNHSTSDRCLADIGRVRRIRRI
jgi:hypothetical protein